MLFAASGFVYGQTPTGAIQGTVRDPSGASIVGAKVTVTDNATGNKQTLKTSAEGIYAARNLDVGAYSVRVEVTGFTTAVIRDIPVNSGSVYTGNITMELGQTTAVIEVEAQAVQVDTARQTLDTPIGENEIRNLPIFGRNFMDLAVLAPGVTVRDGGNIDPTKVNTFRVVGVAGRSGTGTRVEVDGIDITDETVGTTTGNISQDSVSEFTIARSSLDPSTSLTSSGAISIVSKQGSNEIHGTAFLDYYNQDLAARPNYEPDSPETSRKRYGAGAGGALIKNKLFYYGNLEKQDQTQTQIFRNVEFPAIQRERRAAADLSVGLRPARLERQLQIERILSLQSQR